MSFLATFFENYPTMMEEQAVLSEKTTSGWGIRQAILSDDRQFYDRFSDSDCAGML
jgi:hypothetical protein